MSDINKLDVIVGRFISASDEARNTFIDELRTEIERQKAAAEYWRNGFAVLHLKNERLTAEAQKQRAYISEEFKRIAGLEDEIERLKAQVSRDDEHYQAAMAMAEKHRKNWVEACQEREQLRARRYCPES